MTDFQCNNLSFLQIFNVSHITSVQRLTLNIRISEFCSVTDFNVSHVTSVQRVSLKYCISQICPVTDLQCVTRHERLTRCLDTKLGPECETSAEESTFHKKLRPAVFKETNGSNNWREQKKWSCI